MFAICLAARQRDDESATWLTVCKLQDAVSTYQVAPPSASSKPSSPA